MLACVFEIILSALLLIFPDPILKVFGVMETAYSYAVLYYRIVALGCVFQGLSQLFCDFVRVSGKPVLGMCVTGIGAVTNVILDAVFIIIFDWGVTGAASATVIGQIISCGFAFWAAQMAMGFISLVYNSQLGKYGGDIAISDLLATALSILLVLKEKKRMMFHPALQI